MSKCLDPFRFLLISLAGWMNQQWPTSPARSSHAGSSHERLARRSYAPCPRFWRLLFDPWSFRDTRRLANPEVSDGRCNPWLNSGFGGSSFRAIRGIGNDSPSGVSPDGKVLLCGMDDIKKLSLSGERNSEAYLETKYSEGDAVFSPDGRWVAYNSNESGRYEIYVEGYPERRGKWLVSAEGGGLPQWRGDGKELYYRKSDGTLMAASMVLQAGGVQVGRAEALFRAMGQHDYFGSAKDGKRFLAAEQDGSEQAFPMVVQLKYAARLK